MIFKHERLEKNIHHEIMKILSERKIKDPRIPQIVTISGLKLSKDLHYCQLFFTIIGNDKEKTETELGLNNASGFIQKMLAKRLYLKYTPKISFKYDHEREKAYNVTQILNNLSIENSEDN